MADDVQLSRNFMLSEAPCWWLATAAQVARLQETAARVLQPIRTKFGKTQITSWMWWSAGCVPRGGAHSWGGTIDFTVPDAELWDVFEWGNSYLMPTGYIGRWIYEPEVLDEDGKQVQGEHIHMAPRADMIGVFNDPKIQSLRELPSGDLFVYQDWTDGTFAQPYALDPLIVTARAGWGSLLGLGLLFSLFTLDMAQQSQGGWVLRSQP